MKFKVIHTEYEDVLSTVYVLVIYIDTDSDNLFYHTLPIDTLSTIDFSLDDHIRKLHYTSNEIKNIDGRYELDKWIFKQKDVLISNLRQYKLNRVLK